MNNIFIFFSISEKSHFFKNLSEMEYVLEESEIDAKCLVVFHFVSMDTILMEGGERSYV